MMSGKQGLAVCLVAVAGWITLLHPARSASASTAPVELVASNTPEEAPELVWLCTQAPRWDESFLRAACLKAWGQVERISKVEADDPTYDVVGPSGSFRVAWGAHPFLVPEPGAEKNALVEQHRAYVSVSGSEQQLPAARLAAELVTPDALALFSTRLESYTPMVPGTLERLRSAHPERLFETTDPVVAMPPDDLEMQAVIAKARREFPTFRSRWSHKRPGETFSVKAPFGATHEHMWVRVDRIDARSVHGVLANHPEQNPGMAEGDPLTVPVADLSDWIISEGGKIVAGGFSLDLLLKREGTH